MIEVEIKEGHVIEFPDGTPVDEIERQSAAALAQLEGQEGEEGTSLLRGAGLAARGLTDSVINALGGVPDLVSAGLREIGAPAPKDPAFYRKALKGGYQSLSDSLVSPIRSALPDIGTGTPKGTLEKAIYGAGRGVGDAATFMVPGAAVSKMAQAGTLPQRAGQMLAAQPVMQSVAGAVGGGVTEATDSPLAGLAASIATPLASQVGRRMITPIAPQSKNRKRLADAAAEIPGMELTPAQATGSTPLKYLESVFADLPLSSGPQRKIYDEQRKAINREIMGMAGIRADNATPETMTTAFKELGNQFKTLVEKTSIKIDNEFFDTVKDVAKEQARFLGQDTNRAFQAYVDDILKMKNIVNKNPNKTYILSGDDYQNTASRLRRAEREATDPELKRAYQGLIDSFDDMMARSQPKAVQDAWQIARSQYRNLKIIDKAVQGGTNADRVAGNVPLHGLRAAVLGADRAKYSRGGNRLNELSRIGDLLGESIPPNSGTATRGLYTGALTGGPVLAAMFGGADPGSMAAGAGIALGAPRVAQSLYNASGDYLKNQVLPTRPLNRGLFGAIGLERAPSFYEE